MGDGVGGDIDRDDAVRVATRAPQRYRLGMKITAAHARADSSAIRDDLLDRQAPPAGSRCRRR